LLAERRGSERRNAMSEMTREEALEDIRIRLTMLLGSLELAGKLTEDHKHRFARALNDLAALSSPCACGGREPIYEGRARVYEVTIHASYADAGSMKLRGVKLAKNQELEVLAFPPAEEPE